MRSSSQRNDDFGFCQEVHRVIEVHGFQVLVGSQVNLFARRNMALSACERRDAVEKWLLGEALWGWLCNAEHAAMESYKMLQVAMSCSVSRNSS